MRVVVTGASGFVGRETVRVLCESGHEVIAVGRSCIDHPGATFVRSPNLALNADWGDVLAGAFAVVHLAGMKVAARGSVGSSLESSYYKINAEGTKMLAEQCVKSGITHFIYLSSCHAVAEQSSEIMNTSSTPRPHSAYGKSKLAAESTLTKTFCGTRVGWTIFRAPLIYGVNCAANFALLAKAVRIGMPLPFGSIRNKRSFLFVENLANLVNYALGRDASFNKLYYPSDNAVFSTPELIRAIARTIRETAGQTRAASKGSKDTTGCSPTPYSAFSYLQSPRLLPFPECILKMMGRFPGLGALQKLTSSLYVDSEPVTRELGWNPPFTMDVGLRRTLAL